MSKRFLLDSNTFIEANNRYYSMQICPGYWEALTTQHEASRVCSIDRVRDELMLHGDAIKDWIEQRAQPTFFKQTADIGVIEAYRRMVGWVYSQPQFTDAAKAEFATVADGWVIAYAAANGHVVVTHEELAPDAKRKVPMPNLCLEFDVDYCNTFAMQRDLNEQFIRSTVRAKKARKSSD